MRKLLLVSTLAGGSLLALASAAQAQDQVGQSPSTPTDAAVELPAPVPMATSAPQASGASPQAVADAAQAPADAPQTPAAGDIIVTAQFRSQRLQDTPISVLAADGASLERRQINDVKDLAVTFPGLQVGGAQQTTPQYRIRGTRSTALDIASEDSIAVYLDGVYIARPSATTLDLFDLERVEVLRGPQGTLYGRNAVGGVINYITRAPQSKPYAKLAADIGNYDTYNLRGALNVPITDRLFANGAFSIRNRDGFVKSLITGDDLQRQRSASGRLAVRAEASDDLQFTLRGDYNRFRDGGPAYTTRPLTTARVDVSPTTGARTARQVVWWDPYSTDPLLNPTGKVLTDNFYQSLQNTAGFERRDIYGSSLTTDGDLGGVNFTSITAWRHISSDQLVDVDGTPCALNSVAFLASANVRAVAPGSPDLLGQPRCITLQDTVPVGFLLGRTVPTAFGFDINSAQDSRRIDRADQYSQEFRLLSTPGGFFTLGGRLNWVLGGLVFLEDAQRRQFDNQNGLTNSRFYLSRNKSRSFGIYSQGTFDVTKQLSVTGGLRYSYDRKRFAFALQNRAVTGVLASSGGRTVLVSPIDVSSTIDFSNLPGVFGFPTGFPNPAFTNGVGICPVNTRCVPLTRASEKWTSLDPKIALEYRPTSNILLYGSYSQAYKGGGFASTPEDIGTGVTPYEQERLKAFEIGAKTAFFDRRLIFNVAAYRNRTKDVQITGGYDHDNNPSTRPFAGVRNAARLNANGVEIESSLRFIDGLSAFANYAFTDATYADFPVFGGGVQVSDFSGNRSIGTPRHALSIGANAERDLSDKLVLRGSADWNYKSRIFFNEGNYIEASQAAYAVFNANVALELDRTWALRAWVKNAFDKGYLTFATSIGASRTAVLGTPINAGSYSFVPGTPRTFGLTLEWNMGDR